MIIDEIKWTSELYVIAATDRPNDIDEVFLRRVTVVEIKPPKLEVCIDFLKGMVRTYHTLHDKDFVEIARTCKG